MGETPDNTPREQIDPMFDIEVPDAREIRRRQAEERKRVAENNAKQAQEIEDERQRVEKENAAKRETVDHFEMLEAEGLRHFRQDNEGAEDYSKDVAFLDNDECEHNDGDRDGEFGPKQRGFAEPEALDDVLAREREEELEAQGRAS